jgi:hypothetical protein
MMTEGVQVTIHEPTITVEKDMFGTVHIYIQYGAEKFDFININYHGLYTSNAHQKKLADGILKLLGVGGGE